MTIMGGASIAKKLFVGDSVNLIQNFDASSTSVGGTLTIGGGVAIARRVFCSFILFISLGIYW